MRPRMYSEFNKLQGKLLIAARKNAGLTQEELAYKMGFSRTTITNMEAGKQNILSTTLYEFANVCAVPVADLFPTLYTKAEITRLSEDSIKEAERVAELEKENRELKQRLGQSRRWAKKIVDLGEDE